MKSIFVFLLFGATQVSFSQILLERVESARIASKAPALAVLSIYDSKKNVVFTGFRKVDHKNKVQPSDKFHLGSDTKAMTATLVGILVDEKKLQWNSKISELIPDIHPSHKKTTIEMLLAHRAGFTGDIISFNGGKIWKAISDEKLAAVQGRKFFTEEFLRVEPPHSPGSKFEYTNAGYVIVGHIIEKLTGKSWEDSLKDLLFRPLAMNSCGFGALGVANQEPNDPWGHVIEDEKLIPLVLDNPKTLGPAATVHCSLEDWSKFVVLHLEAYNGKPKLLSADSFSKLHSSYPGQEYTYGGWMRTETSWAGGVAFTHDGSNTLNYASAWWAPKKKIVLLGASNVGEPHGQKAVQGGLVELLKDIR